MSLQWPIQGHLSEQDALKVVETAEGALKFNRIDKNDVKLGRCIKLRNRTIYNFEESNENAENPNSFCNVMHAYELDNDRDKSAVANILIYLLDEPAFNQLRTQEQLGYIVRAHIEKIFRVIHFNIYVQSSSKDADYLEHRINNFLDGFRKKDTPFTEESVESMKLGIIGLVKQKNTNLGMECDQNVLQIKQGDINFDRKEQLIAALERVTADKVNALFREVFFENPRRFNLKIHSHVHRDDTETRKTSQDLNTAFYKEIETATGKKLEFTTVADVAGFRKNHSFHPRV